MQLFVQVLFPCVNKWVNFFKANQTFSAELPYNGIFHFAYARCKKKKKILPTLKYSSLRHTKWYINMWFLIYIFMENCFIMLLSNRLQPQEYPLKLNASINIDFQIYNTQLNLLKHRKIQLSSLAFMIW